MPWWHAGWANPPDACLGGHALRPAPLPSSRCCNASTASCRRRLTACWRTRRRRRLQQFRAHPTRAPCQAHRHRRSWTMLWTSSSGQQAAQVTQPPLPTFFRRAIAVDPPPPGPSAVQPAAGAGSAWLACGVPGCPGGTDADDSMGGPTGSVPMDPRLQVSATCAPRATLRHPAPPFFYLPLTCRAGSSLASLATSTADDPAGGQALPPPAG
jgi:hypothetical protein